MHGYICVGVQGVCVLIKLFKISLKEKILWVDKFHNVECSTLSIQNCKIRRNSILQNLLASQKLQNKNSSLIDLEGANFSKSELQLFVVGLFHVNTWDVHRSMSWIFFF